MRGLRSARAGAGVVLAVLAVLSPGPALALPLVPPLRSPPPAAPGDDPFYSPPPRLSGRPGDILRFRPVTAYTDRARAVPVPARAWQVLYRSSTALDEPNAVSGTVLVPLAPWPGPGPRPIVAFAPGTHGLGDQCAPSYRLALGQEAELVLFGQALARGWAVALTDYEGLGTPGDHTYLIGQSEGRAVLDIARAAVRLPGAQLSAGAPVAVWGYSQGGGAAASAAELAARYAPDLAVKGTSAGGVPADLIPLTRLYDGSPLFGLLVAAVAGFDAAYPGLRLERLLNDAGRAAVADVRDDCTAEVTRGLEDVTLSQLATTDLLRYRPLRQRLVENSAGSTAPAAPVRVYHARRDEVVPYEQGLGLFADYCALGVPVEFFEVPAGTHATAAVVDAPATVAYLAARFVGLPPPDDCLQGSALPAAPGAMP